MKKKKKKKTTQQLSTGPPPVESYKASAASRYFYSEEVPAGGTLPMIGVRVLLRCQQQQRRLRTERPQRTIIILCPQRAGFC